MTAAPTLSILFLGDSYTCGEGVNKEHSYPMQLSKRLTEVLKIPVEPTVLATTGWTTTELVSQLPQLPASMQYDYIFLCIGVNNQYRGWSIDIFNRDLDQLWLYIQSHRRYADRGVWVWSIPDYGYTPFGLARQESISTDIDRYNFFLKNYCMEKGASWIDITALSRLRPTDPEWLAADGLHPSAWQYSAWIEVALPLILQSLHSHRGAP